ncbi:MAG: 30S ribosomal protein S16 [Acidobacteriota bacterium]
MVRIRLRRMGTRSKPFYRVVVSDSRRVPTSRVMESLGYYDPRHKPAALQIDVGRADYWIAQGAQASQTVRGLLKRARGAAV